MGMPVAVIETYRQLARVVELDDVIAHPNADRLDLAIIGGWQVIVAKGMWKKGDKALYCEVGSLLPISVPELAEAARENTKELGGIVYAHIKSIKLRGEISQGFVARIPKEHASKPAGTNLSMELGVMKYEADSAAGTVKKVVATTAWGRFINRVTGEIPSDLLPFPEKYASKSDQPRVQNIAGRLQSLVGRSLEESVKLDGNSATMYFEVSVDGEGEDDVISGIASRERELRTKALDIGYIRAGRIFLGRLLNEIRRKLRGADKFYMPKFSKIIEAPHNPHRQIYEKYLSLKVDRKILQFMIKNGFEHMAIQGELIGPGVTAGNRHNHEGVAALQLCVYAVYVNGGKIAPRKAREYIRELGLEYVPVPDSDFRIDGHDAKSLLARADGERALTKGGLREGLVYKDNEGGLEFKVVSNKFLLKHGDD